jgi:hypothetical protein
MVYCIEDLKRRFGPSQLSRFGLFIPCKFGVGDAQVSPMSKLWLLFRYTGRPILFISFVTILYILMDAFLSLFHSPLQVLHLTSPCLKIVFSFSGLDYLHFRNV